MPMIHRLSRQSTSVAPSPSQLCDLFDTGLSSSMPHAYLVVVVQEVVAAVAVVVWWRGGGGAAVAARHLR